MTTFQAICVEDYTVRDIDGATWTAVRGREYTISPPKDGTVVCFSNYWVTCPERIFAGLKPFTGPDTKFETEITVFD